MKNKLVNIWIHHQLMLYWKNSNLSSFHVLLNFLNHSRSFLLHYIITLLYMYNTFLIIFRTLHCCIHSSKKWGPNLNLLSIWRSYSHAAQSWSFLSSSLQDQTCLLQSPSPKPTSLKRKKSKTRLNQKDVQQHNNARRCQFLYPTHWFTTPPVTSLHNRHSTKSLSQRESWTRSLHVTSSSLV